MMSKGRALWMLVAAAWVNPGFLNIDLRRGRDDRKQNTLAPVAGRNNLSKRYS
jgi:hypothetical protein